MRVLWPLLDDRYDAGNPLFVFLAESQAISLRIVDGQDREVLFVVDAVLAEDRVVDVGIAQYVSIPVEQDRGHGFFATAQVDQLALPGTASRARSARARSHTRTPGSGSGAKPSFVEPLVELLQVPLFVFELYPERHNAKVHVIAPL